MNPVVLFWVPRFWPAVGGTELHTHALASRLLERFPVEVITHCDVTATAERTLAEDVCEAPRATRTEGRLVIHHLGLGGTRSAVLSGLAARHDRDRFARLAFGHVLARRVGPAAREIARRASLVHFVYNGLTDAAVLARRTAVHRGVPFVFTPNVCDTSAAGSAWSSLRLRRLYRSASRLIALTDHEADWLVDQGADRRTISVVPYGPILEPEPDGRRFRDRFGGSDGPVVLFLGRVVDIKGYDLLLDARERIWSRFPDARIVFVGPATTASREAIRAAGDDRLVLLENLDQRAKADALAGCDLLCLPSRAESLGVAYIEAAFNAKAVVALDLPVLRQVVVNERHGLKVQESAAAVAGAICTLLDDPERCRLIGERAERDARARYDWPSVCDAVAEVYAMTLRSHPA